MESKTLGKYSEFIIFTSHERNYLKIVWRLLQVEIGELCKFKLETFARFGKEHPLVLPFFVFYHL